MESVDKKRIDFQIFVKRKISEKEAELRQKKYNQLQIQAKVYDLNPIQDINFLYKVGVDKSGNTIIFLVGYFFPMDKKRMELAFYYFIFFMDELVDGPYILVYFHNGVSAFDKRIINFLKDLYKDLPMKYFMNLTQFYTVDLPWIMRWDIEYGFNNILKFFKKVAFYLPGVEQLENQPFFLKEFSNYIPDFRAHEKSITLKMAKQTIFGKHLSDYCLAENGIPYIFIALFLYFEDNEDNNKIKTEGIFRKAAGASDVQKLVFNLENGNYEAIFTVKDPLIIADLVKKLLKNLAEPLFPAICYNEFLKFEFVPEHNEIKFLKTIIKNMPLLNYKVLNFILRFFKKVNQYEEKNLMTAKNIAICITPCILRNTVSNDNKSSADLHKEIAKSFILVNCVKNIIEKYDEIFSEDDEENPDLENVMRRKTLVIQEMKQFAKFEEEKQFLSTRK